MEDGNGLHVAREDTRGDVAVALGGLLGLAIAIAMLRMAPLADGRTLAALAVAGGTILLAPGLPAAVSRLSGLRPRSPVHRRRRPRTARARPPAHDALAARTADGDRLAALRLGELLQKTGDDEGAYAAFRSAADGNDAVAQTASLSLGVLHQGLGDHRRARVANGRATRLPGPAAESAAVLLRWLPARD